MSKSREDLDYTPPWNMGYQY